MGLLAGWAAWLEHVLRPLNVIVIDIVIVFNTMQVMVLYDCWLGGQLCLGLCCVPYIFKNEGDVKLTVPMRRIMMMMMKKR